MTKAELIEALSNKLPLNKADAERAINIVLDDVIAALSQGERVNISGFGTFSVSERPGAHRAQSKDRRIDRDRGQPLGQVQAGQAVEGLAQRRRRRSAGVVALDRFVNAARVRDCQSRSIQ